MSIGVCIPLPGDGIIQKNWDFVLSNFKPDVLYVIGSVEDAPSTNVFQKSGAIYIDTAEELPEDTPLVIMAPEHGRYVQGDISLTDFSHPEEVIYLFGHDNHPLSEDLLGEQDSDLKVYIPTDSTDDMYSYVAYAVTIWDRMMKYG